MPAASRQLDSRYLWYLNTVGMGKRRTRLEANEQNRALVLDAARRQFLERGFHGATLDAIAAAAGFSKGVVYSQFGGKDDLFLTLLEARIDERRANSAALAAGLSGPEGFAVIARDAIGVSADSVAWQTLLLEFRAHAARHPATNARYAALHRRTIDGTAAIVSGLFERAGMAPPIPADALALLVLAVGTGLSAELAVDPDLDVRAIAGLLADALNAQAARPSGVA